MYNAVILTTFCQNIVNYFIVSALFVPLYLSIYGFHRPAYEDRLSLMEIETLSKTQETADLVMAFKILVTPGGGPLTSF